MPTITIDDKKIEVASGTTVLQAALANGIYIPHFCYHPRLSIAGNCRMCVVELEGRSKLEISCNLQVADGMTVRTDTPATRNMRKAVLEFLLINHPLDCPICDQAGECYLQDYHFKYSGDPSRFKEEKVRKPKVVDIGPYIKLDDERCVLCTRCVRFCKEIAETSDLCVAKRGDRAFITTAPGGKLDNPYSLNTVDLCPVGALTSRDFRFKKRVWLLRSTSSVCPGCANGCPIWIDHEGGVMYRWRPRNGWLCDEGRLSYKEWQTDSRLQKPLVRTGDSRASTSVGEAVSMASSIFKGAGLDGIVGVVSSQCSCEEVDAFTGFLWGKFKVKKIYSVGRQPENPSEDNILRKRDKNPNTTYLQRIGLLPLPPVVDGEVLFVADSIPKDDLLKIVNFKWKAIIQITHDSSLVIPGADVVLPKAAFAEQAGTFVNFAGEAQRFMKAFDPKGEAKSVAEWMNYVFTY